MPPERLALDDRAELRVLREDDVGPAYVDGLNDPDVHRYLVAPRLHRQDGASVRQFVADNAADPGAVLYGLFLDDVLRGTVRLHGIDVSAGRAEIGIALFDRSIWGQGWGRRCLGAVCEAAASGGLRRVIAGIDARNLGSQRAFQQAGFIHLVADDYVLDGEPAQRWVRVLDWASGE